MAGETSVVVIGNLTEAPELRFTQAGVAVAGFTIASTPRTFDRNSNEWKDGETLFMRCSIWREAAEQVAQSLAKGMRVIAQGDLKQRSFEDKKSGEKRTVIEMEVQEIGPSLRYATAQVTRTQRGNQGGGSSNTTTSTDNFGVQGQQAAQQPWGGQQTPAPQHDPWGQPQSNGAPF